jgi:signal transduction histidine kinase/CheY-like chemotaxis protein
VTKLVGLAGGSIARRLELACVLVDAMIDDETGFLDDLGLPAAMFGSLPIPERSNLAWRAVFGNQLLSRRLLAHLELTRTTGERTFDAALSVALHRRTSGAVIVCAAPGATERVSEVASERAARVNAEHANAMKDRFLAAVSHELRTPITTMLLWEKILRDPSSSAALQATAIDAIHQSAETQARLVDDLLDVSRATSGKLHIDLSTIDVDKILDAAIAAITPGAIAKDIAIERRASIAGVVLGDRTRIRQIFDNLLANAIKFTAGRIVVSANRDADNVTIEIADNGRGISPELLPKLFEPFSQGDAVFRATGGLGLGLAISRELATLHRGTLTARSDGERRGSIFTLTLPCAAANEQRSLMSVRVLVVDDDPRVLDALTLLLDDAGAIVVTADSVATARAKIARDPPHALICDLTMPGEDGYSLVRELRAAGSTIPAIALTAHTSVDDIQRARAAGFEVHLAKPIDFGKLVDNLGQLVSAIA